MIAAIALGLVVLVSWVGCIGFLRLRSAYDRLHCASYVTAGAGVPLAIAAFAADGVSARAVKLLFLVIASLLSSAALTHAVGRALLLRSHLRS